MYHASTSSMIRPFVTGAGIKLGLADRRRGGKDTTRQQCLPYLDCRFWYVQPNLYNPFPRYGEKGSTLKGYIVHRLIVKVLLPRNSRIFPPPRCVGSGLFATFSDLSRAVDSCTFFVIATCDAIIVYHPFNRPFFRGRLTTQLRK